MYIDLIPFAGTEGIRLRHSYQNKEDNIATILFETDATFVDVSRLAHSKCKRVVYL